MPTIQIVNCACCGSGSTVPCYCNGKLASNSMTVWATDPTVAINTLIPPGQPNAGNAVSSLYNTIFDYGYTFGNQFTTPFPCLWAPLPPTTFGQQLPRYFTVVRLIIGEGGSLLGATLTVTDSFSGGIQATYNSPTFSCCGVNQFALSSGDPSVWLPSLFTVGIGCPYIGMIPNSVNVSLFNYSDTTRFSNPPNGIPCPQRNVSFVANWRTVQSYFLGNPQAGPLTRTVDLNGWYGEYAVSGVGTARMIIVPDSGAFNVLTNVYTSVPTATMVPCTIFIGWDGIAGLPASAVLSAAMGSVIIPYATFTGASNDINNYPPGINTSGGFGLHGGLFVIGSYFQCNDSSPFTPQWGQDISVTPAADTGYSNDPPRTSNGFDISAITTGTIPVPRFIISGGPYAGTYTGGIGTNPNNPLSIVVGGTDGTTLQVFVGLGFGGWLAQYAIFEPVTQSYEYAVTGSTIWPLSLRFGGAFIGSSLQVLSP